LNEFGISNPLQRLKRYWRIVHPVRTGFLFLLLFLLLSCKSTFFEPLRLNSSFWNPFRWTTGPREVLLEMGPPSAGQFKAVALADFNGDGTIDLAGGDAKKNRIYVWYGSPGIKWSRPISFKVEGEVRDIAAIDLNSDGISDIAYSLRGTPGGIYTWISAPQQKNKWVAGIPAATEGLYEGLSVADVDGDGHWDLAAANATTEQNGGVQVFRGDGKGGWSTEFGPTRAGIFRDVRLIDLNGDRGRLEGTPSRSEGEFLGGLGLGLES
jgi:hypothetical protein